MISDLSAYQGEHPELFRCDLLWNARVCGDALPLLHKAVLHKVRDKHRDSIMIL